MVVNIRSNPINIISRLVEIINSKYQLLRACAYFIFWYQITVVLLIVEDVVVD